MAHAATGSRAVAAAPVPSADTALAKTPAAASSAVVAAEGPGHELAKPEARGELAEKGAAELALPPERSRVSDITFRGPIAEDADGGGGRHAEMVGTMWSNIPNHVRESFVVPKSTDDVPKTSQPMLMDQVIANAKALAVSTGFAPAKWAENQAVYYGGQLPLAPYQKGQVAAYNYPEVLVPRDMAFRFPQEMYVDPVFATSDPELRFHMKSRTLFTYLQGKTTLMMIFSGQPLSGLFTGVRHWLNEVGQEFGALPQTQVFKLHCDESWLSRSSSGLTKFQLRRQVEPEELFSTFVYKGKWRWEYVQALHLYDKQLPTVLLLDRLGYVRWHAVGLPTSEATETFRALARRLARERRRHI